MAQFLQPGGELEEPCILFVALVGTVTVPGGKQGAPGEAPDPPWEGTA